MLMYVTLRSIGVEDSVKKRTYKARLKNNPGYVEVSITLKAETKEDLKDLLRTIRKGAVFELKLEPVSSLNDRKLDEFIDVEEVEG